MFGKFQKENKKSKQRKMPKFQGSCNNPLHESLCKREGEKVINLRNRGLIAEASAFEKFIQEELDKSRFQINNLCSTCLKTCLRKRKFTKFLSKDVANNLQNKVQREVKNLNSLSTLQHYKSCKAARIIHCFSNYN